MNVGRHSPVEGGWAGRKWAFLLYVIYGYPLGINTNMNQVVLRIQGTCLFLESVFQFTARREWSSCWGAPGMLKNTMNLKCLINSLFISFSHLFMFNFSNLPLLCCECVRVGEKQSIYVSHCGVVHSFKFSVKRTVDYWSANRPEWGACRTSCGNLVNIITKYGSSGDFVSKEHSYFLNQSELHSTKRMAEVT